MQDFNLPDHRDVFSSSLLAGISQITYSVLNSREHLVHTQRLLRTGLAPPWRGAQARLGGAIFQAVVCKHLSVLSFEYFSQSNASQKSRNKYHNGTGNSLTANSSFKEPPKEVFKLPLEDFTAIPNTWCILLLWWQSSGNLQHFSSNE